MALSMLVANDPASGMPGFARKYKMSCTTCHGPFPRLKAYGAEFAGRGFRLEDPSQEPARATYDVGDPLLTLFREVPIGIRLEGFASWKEDAVAETDVEWPWAWKIISGGPISESAAYYFYFLVERGEVEGLEDAYIQLNSPFGLPFDLLAGQFQVSDPMFKRETRLERTDYQIYRTRVGDGSPNLTYDRGAVLGLELPGAIETVFQVVNGNGIPHSDEERNFDNDKYKNFALHLARSVGDVRLGVFGYYGKQEDEAGIDNETYYVGPDASLAFDPPENLRWLLGKRTEVNLQYLERRDDDPFFENYQGDDFETRGGFAEVHAFLQGVDGRWVVSALYNKVDSDDSSEDAETATVTVNHLLARNLRLLIEGGRDIERERNIGIVGFVSAF
jgi:hypothetical protein